MKKAYTHKEIPVVGTRINKWTVISDEIVRKNGRSYIKVKCECSDEEHLILYHHYIDKKSKGCQKCSKPNTWKGYELIDGSYWSMIQSGAKRRGIPFNLSIEYVWDLYLRQNMQCAISGVTITFAPSTRKEDLVYRTASLDRIDSTKGYVIGNVQWVHKDVNIMKNKFSQQQFDRFIIDAASHVCLDVKFKKLSPLAKTPTYAKAGDAGLDLTATSFQIDERGYFVYGVGLAFEIPEGYVGLLFPRSSNAKKDLLLSNSVGVLDSGYRGEVTFKFRPTQNGAISYAVGDRIGQLIIIPYPQINLIESDELSETERGTGGYGSSGE